MRLPGLAVSVTSGLPRGSGLVLDTLQGPGFSYPRCEVNINKARLLANTVKEFLLVPRVRPDRTVLVHRKKVARRPQKLRMKYRP